MQLKFNHIALRVQEPKIIKTFFIKLGLKQGERPNFPFEGYWLYSEEKPIIHIFGDSAKFRDENRNEIVYPERVVDHICFTSNSYETVIENINRYSLKYSENILLGGTKFFPPNSLFAS